MAALITYDITQKDVRSAGKNLVFLALGGVALFFLCKSGFEGVAWVLLAIPPFFFTALLALLVITQIVKTKVTYDDGESTSITGDSFKRMLGLTRMVGDDATNGVVDRLVGKPFQDACNTIATFPSKIPTFPSKERIAKELGVTNEECDMCS